MIDARVNIMVYMEEYHTSLDIIFLRLLKKIDRWRIVVVASSKKRALLGSEFDDLEFVEKPVNYSRKRIRVILQNRKHVSCLLSAIKHYQTDLVFFTTPQATALNLELPRLSKITKIILFCHNIDEYCKSFRKSSMSTHDYRKIPHIRALINRRLLNASSGAILLTEYLLDKFRACFPEVYATVVPFRLSSKSDLEERVLRIRNEDIPTFSISGSVDESRRQYESIFEAFQSVNNTERYRLVLLGITKDRSVIDKGVKMLGDHLMYFEDFLPEAEYNSWLKRSHFLIAGLSGRQPYGVLKASGVEFDGPALGIPVLAEETMLQNSSKGYYVRYTNADHLSKLLSKIIHSVNSGNYFEEYLRISLDKASYFLQENWVDSLKEFVESIIVS